MAIVATEIESVHGALGQQRMIFYRCQDSEGVWHQYGPVITIDDNFDADAHKTVVAVKVAESLAAAEAEQLLGE
jgi:N-acyl-D-aspartate/D-glutamate deacylase